MPLFVTVLFLVGVKLVFILVIALVLLFVQYFFSDRIALYSMGGKIVTREQAPQLHGVVDRLCAMANMPKPQVAIANVDMPNAFATGRDQKHAVVCVTTGILRRLDEPELEAVLAHELSHVAHRDVAVMTIASFLGILAGLLTRVLLYAGLFGGFGGGGNRNQGGGKPGRPAGSCSSSACSLSRRSSTRSASCSIRTLSRYRELAADRSGAILIGQPRLLAQALVKVTGEMSRIPTRDLRAAEHFNAFFFAPAFAKGVSLSTPLLDPPHARAPPAAADRARGPDGARRVKLFDVLLGRTKPVQPDLDHLFGLPGAEITLEASAGLRPTGAGRRLLQAGLRAAVRPDRRRRSSSCSTSATDAKIHEESDSYGYRWVVIADDDFGDLINEVHVVNTTLEEHGWGPQLLCSVFGFEPVPGGAADAGAATGAQKVAGPISSTSTSGARSTPSCPLPAAEKRDSDRERLLNVMLATDLADGARPRALVPSVGAAGPLKLPGARVPSRRRASQPRARLGMRTRPGPTPEGHFAGS